MTKPTYNIIFVWLLLFNCFGVFAQDNLSIAQLRDSIKVYADSNPKKSLKFGLKLEKELRDNNDIEALIKLKIALARQSLKQSQYEIATQKVQEAIILSDLQHDDKLKANAYKNLGNIYFVKEDYLSAIKYYSVSDSLGNDPFHSLKIRYNYSGIKQSIGDYEEALDIRLHLQKELKQFDNDIAERISINNILNILNIYKTLLKKDSIHKKTYLEGIDKYSKEFINSNSYNEVQHVIFELTHLSISLTQDINKQIISKYDSLQKRLWKNNIHSSDRMIFFDISKSFYKLREFNKALDYLQKIDSIDAKNSANMRYRDEIDLFYSKVYRALGKTDLALKKMESANAIMNKKERQREEVSLVLRDHYNYNAINQKFRLLKKDNNSSSFTYYISILLFIALLTFYFLYRKRKIKDIKKTDLIKENQIEENSNTDKSNNSFLISKDVIEESLLKLKQYEKTKLYLSANTDLDSIADFIGQNRVYTSKIFNDYLNTSFKDYINKLRIDYAIRKINESEEFRNLSIDILTERLGYKSASTFTRVFKQETGFTPYQYIMQVKKTFK